MKHFTRTLLELGFMALFGFLPVWASILFSTKSLNSYLISGEAILLSASLIGPLIYKISEVNEDVELKNGFKFNIHFPKYLLILISLAICLYSTGLFVYKDIDNKSAMNLHDSAVWLVNISVAIWVLTIFYSRYESETAPSKSRNDTEEYIEKYKGGS